MSVTRVHVTGREQYFDQVDRLISSHTLHSSESLCRLLRYLAEHSLDHPGAALKEYQIAVEVFGRPSDFDPQLDSTVRVQAGRLRQKLTEYYASEGPEDPILVELPKGTYLLSFHQRGPTLMPGLGDAKEDQQATSAPSTPKSGIAIAVLSVLLLVAIALIAGLWAARRIPEPNPSASQAAPAAFRVFWNGFVSAPDEPWVVFSNGAFVGRPEIGMRYFDPRRDSPDSIMDHYTGVGEVLAIHELDRLFGMLGKRVRVKRGSLFSLDDAQNNNLIFVGSPAENLSLRDLPNTQQFVFRRLPSGPRKGDLGIMNVHPQPGEPDVFLASSASGPINEDYAIIGLVHGLNPARSVMILAGTTTLGTEAAAEYVTRQSSLEELLLRLSVTSSGDLTPFEAVLRVKVTRGVPVESKVVALRKSAP